MPAMKPLFKKAYWSLAGLGALYAMFLGCLTSPYIQKNALYVHKLNTMWFQSVNEPEAWGFAPRQVTPFKLVNSEETWLYCWHVLPLQVYAANEDKLLQEPGGMHEDFRDSLGYRLLMDDPEARVVINFHGNAGHIAQGHRPQIYRALTTSSPHIHVLTFDYRGFGYSSGDPTEIGLIADAVAFVQNVISLGIPPSRIVLLGQSLGTAVASAVSLHLASQEASLALLPPSIHDLANEETLTALSASTTGVDFAGVILVGSFSSLPTLLMTYRIGGVLPVLSPIRYYPRIQKLLLSRIVDEWKSEDRLRALTGLYAGFSADGASKGRKLDLLVLHARDDADIPWQNGREAYRAALAGFTDVVPNAEVKELIEDGLMVSSVGTEDGNTKVKFELLRFGGHNAIAEGVPTTLAVLKALGLANVTAP